MAASTGSKQTYQWTTGRNDALSFQTTNRMDLWNPAIWQPLNLWDFFKTRSHTLGQGQFRAPPREHVFVFQYKCPIYGWPGDPNLRLLNHRSSMLIQKRALESNVCRHYTGHETFKFMASVETLKEMHEVCRLQVNGSSTIEWGRDC